MKSGLNGQTEVRSSTSRQENFALAAGNGLETRSIPQHSHPRAANALDQPQRPQKRSSILMVLNYP